MWKNGQAVRLEARAKVIGTGTNGRRFKCFFYQLFLCINLKGFLLSSHSLGIKFFR